MAIYMKMYSLSTIFVNKFNDYGQVSMAPRARRHFKDGAQTVKHIDYAINGSCY